MKKKNNKKVVKSARENLTAAKQKEKVIELLEIDGKKVSKTSTGKRKFHNKSKTGCLNCKRRRVKCDETKPFCIKCTNMKLDCVYVTPLPNTNSDGTNNSNNSTNSNATGPIVKYVTRKEDGTIETTEASTATPVVSDSSNGTPSTRKAKNTTRVKLENESPQNLTNNDTFNDFQAQFLRKNPEMATESALFTAMSNNNTTNNSFSSGSDPIVPLLGSAFNNNNIANTINSRTNTNLLTNFNNNGVASLPSTNFLNQSPNNNNNINNNILSNERNQSIDFSTSPTSLYLTPVLNNNTTVPSPKKVISGPDHTHQQLQYQLYQQLQLQQHQQLQLQQNENLQLQQQVLQQQQQQLLQQFLNQNQGQTQNNSSHSNIAARLQSMNEQSIIPSQININHKSSSTFNNENTISLQEDALSQLDKLGLNLKMLGNLPTAGIGGIQYDFNELLGMKVNTKTGNTINNEGNNGTRAAKASSAREILTDMQQQHERATREKQEYAKGKDNLNPNLNDIATAISTSQSLPSIYSINNETINSETPTNNDHENSDSSISQLLKLSTKANLNLIDMKLFHHYCSVVCSTITSAQFSTPEVWSKDVPELAFIYPFLMHSLLAFSATHLSRTESGLEQYVSSHRLDALKLLREAVMEISDENTDALVASALILIMDSLANASTSTTNTMSPSAWIFHVKGAATILTAVWPLNENSRFYDLISVDLSDLGNVITSNNSKDSTGMTELVCFDESISDLYPVEINSPYLITLAYLDKLNKEVNESDFILRIFAFPALLDKTFLALLMTGDLNAMRIMRCYYKLLRGYTMKVKDNVWFLEGVSQVLPQDVDEYSGGGGMHMMLDFLGGGLPSMTTTNLSDFI
ncbi:hypothetical protein KAFR_0B06340 [Kazachstania africana CBS 2517]|uniref:Zn(2)-C6 fungal-type domain-containing protein n=1 Tax=Kazachstania africana (strain ATCC 22294 / BCRC 22015 / CBS 2517 / CECT 1963 / NBRC 1671 / NRRL Y-8276) TaxID=1071382 RepID=H2ARD0_KAZAF|nr:hypothetical protein KAFR_0B06340 [Kazachstania africana CBS 2517]CCF56930.1 hypothetical protein KAFR_0B06340 [Kazachstania africana CBS 2517]